MSKILTNWSVEITLKDKDSAKNNRFTGLVLNSLKFILSHFWCHVAIIVSYTLGVLGSYSALLEV